MAHSLDLLLESLHQPGRYLSAVYLLVCFNYFPVAFNHLAMAFYGSKSPFRCATAGSFASNQTYFELSACYGIIKGDNSTVTCSDGWIHKLPAPERTIISEWDLVCDQAFLSNLATTIYFIGVMAGGVAYGFLADSFGRKPIMLSSLFVSVAVGTAISFMPTYGAFVALRFIQGALMQGLQATSYTLLMEISVTRYRAYMGALFEVFWAVGLMLLACIAYLIQDWRYIQLAISLPSILTLPYIWLIPESPRWLLLQHKVQQARSFFGKMASWNCTTVDPDLLSALVDEFHHEALSKRKYTAVDLCKTSKLRRRSAMLFFIWLVTSLGYYGLSLSVTDMAGNKYLNFFIAAAVELPAYASGIYILNRFGRKKPLVLYFLFAGVACICAGVIKSKTSETLRISATALALFGKFNMAGAFSVIFLYASEIYPTIMRNVGLGMCAVWLRLGGVVAPQLLLLSKYTVSWLPIVVFGSLSLGASCVTMFLPETLNTKLPDTVAQSEQLRRRRVAKPPSNQHRDAMPLNAAVTNPHKDVIPADNLLTNQHRDAMLFDAAVTNPHKEAIPADDLLTNQHRDRDAVTINGSVSNGVCGV